MGGFSWHADELAVLRAMYPDCYSPDVAALLGRSVKSVHEKAKAMGLRKSAEFMRAQGLLQQARARSDPRVRSGQFRAGQVPWNKGKPGTTGLHDNCRKGWFKSRPAHEARNYRPIGSLRIGYDGELQRKVTDDRSVVPARRWVAVARLVWEAAHGPVPRGHIVVFRRPEWRTTDAAAITLDRVECISMAENARRNHPARRNPEWFRLLQLKGAITRQANRIAREARA